MHVTKKTTSWLMSPRWKHSSSLTLLHLIRTTTDIYSRTRQHLQNPRVQGWGWSTPCISRTKTDQIRRVRGALTEPPLPRRAPHHTERSPLSLWFPQWEKRTKRGKPVSPSTVGSFVGACTLISHHGDCSGICSGICNAGNLTVMEKRGGLATTGTHILSGQVHPCSAEVLIPTSSFAHLQNQVGVALWPRNLVGCRPAWFGSADGFCQPCSLVCPCRVKVLSRSPTHCGGCSPAPSNQKDWWQLLEAVWSDNTWAKRWVGRAYRPRSKVTGPVWSANLDCGSAWVKTTEF